MDIPMIVAGTASSCSRVRTVTVVADRKRKSLLSKIFKKTPENYFFFSVLHESFSENPLQEKYKYL